MAQTADFLLYLLIECRVFTNEIKAQADLQFVKIFGD